MPDAYVRRQSKAVASPRNSSYRLTQKLPTSIDVSVEVTMGLSKIGLNLMNIVE